MSIVVNTNQQSLFAQRALSKNTSGLQKSLEKLSTGYKINRAADDAAGLSISENLTSEIRGLGKAKQNIGDAISMLQTAEGGLSSVQSHLQRIRELFVQASNETNSNDELDSIQREINELVDGLDAVAEATFFNGKNLLIDGSFSTQEDKVIQTGANNNETYTIVLDPTGAPGVGINIHEGSTANGSMGEGASSPLVSIHVGGSGSVTSVDGTTTSANGSLADLDIMIDNVSRMRSYVGAVQNSMESFLEYTDVAVENAKSSRSRIQDVDVAKESSVMVKQQIVQQSAASMLSQANSSPQIALNLLP